jgi:hypothetical protein
MANDWSDLDFAFARPESVTDKDLVTGYESLLKRLRDEAEGLDISTAQILRGSIVIGWFVKHQQTSRRLYGDPGAYAHPGQEKDAIMSWREVAKDWDEVLRKAKAALAAVNGIPVEAVQAAIIGVLEKVDEETRVVLQAEFADAFEKLGV